MTAPFPAPTFTGPRLQAAIIDLDGTMIDTADDFTAGLNGMLAQLDAEETSREEVVGYVGKGSEHLIRSVLAPRFEADHAQDRFDEALAIYQAEYAKINGLHTRLYPDVEAGLTRHARCRPQARVRDQQAASVRGRIAAAVRARAVFQRRARRRQSARKRSRTRCRCSPPRRNWASSRRPRSRSAIRKTTRWRAARPAWRRSRVPYGYNHGQAIQTIKSDGIVASLLDAAKAIAAHQSTT